MARGDFTATDLGRISARLNTLFNGERYNAQLNQPYDAVKAQLERQTASFGTIEVNGVCRGVKATFLKDCEDTMIDCINAPISECKVVGKRVESVSVNYDINDCLSDGIEVYDDECDNNSVKAAEKVAFGIAKFFGKLRFNLEQKYIAFLDANPKDWNGLTLDYGTAGTDTTHLEFAAADWTADIVGKLQWMADQYNVFTPFMIDSGNLWLEDWMNKFKTNGCCTIDSLGSNGPIDLVYATRTASQTTGHASTFLVDPDAVAFWTRNYYQSTTPVPMQDEYNSYVWKMPVPGLQYADGGSLKQIYVDVIRQRQCEVSGGQHRWKTVWYLKLHFAWILGPDICATGDTGIIHATKV